MIWAPVCFVTPPGSCAISLFKTATFEGIVWLFGFGGGESFTLCGLKASSCTKVCALSLSKSNSDGLSYSESTSTGLESKLFKLIGSASLKNPFAPEKSLKDSSIFTSSAADALLNAASVCFARASSAVTTSSGTVFISISACFFKAWTIFLPTPWGSLFSAICQPFSFISSYFKALSA